MDLYADFELVEGAGFIFFFNVDIITWLISISSNKSLSAFHITKLSNQIQKLELLGLCDEKKQAENFTTDNSKKF